MTFEPTLLTGISLILVGAFADGSAGVLIKYTRVWGWEHLWLVYSFLAFALIPWIIGSVSVTNLPQVLASAEHGTVGLVLLFGIGWGCGAVLYGLALRLVGLALTYAIVMGLTAAIGSLAPLVLLHPNELFTPRGHIIELGVALVVSGVVLCGWAAYLKDRALNSISAATQEPQKILVGISIAVLAGIFSPMLNLCFVYGSPLAAHAARYGANPLLAPNVIWTVGLFGGSLVNMGYCSYLISKRQSWNLLFTRSSDNFLGLLMGFIGPLGTVFYGMGSSQLGELGAVVGWPIMSSMGILSANFWGALTGEWRSTGQKPMLLMATAVVLLLGAMVLLGWANSVG